MRKLTEFPVRDWLTLAPLRQGLRQVRNDLLLALYKRKAAPQLPAFLAAQRHLSGANIAIVIAFEQPWALNWLLKMAHVNLPGATVLVFDNSRQPAARAAIESVCRAHGAPYLALPRYRTRHVNRSHGMAMSWIYHNVVRALRPRIFAFLDHDLIPVAPVDFSERLGDQPVFGLLNAGAFAYWSTWAGYCVFSFDAVADRPLNFLYDFSRGLDTGGRNWDVLYSSLARERLRFAERQMVDLSLPAGGPRRQVELIDRRWVHIGGIGYNDNFNEKFAFFERLASLLDSGTNWNDLMRQT